MCKCKMGKIMQLRHEVLGPSTENRNVMCESVKKKVPQWM